MPSQSPALSRRAFVEHSALAAGLLGAASGMAPTGACGAEAAEVSALAAASPVNARQHGVKGDGKTDRQTKAFLID